MGRAESSEAITPPRLPASSDNADLHHVQSLRLITKVNRCSDNWLSQHHDTRAVAPLLTWKCNPCLFPAQPTEPGWRKLLPSSEAFSARIYQFFHAIMVFTRSLVQGCSQGWLMESETSPSLHFLRWSWNFTKMCKRKAAPSPDFPPPEGGSPLLTPEPPHTIAGTNLARPRAPHGPAAAPTDVFYK